MINQQVEHMYIRTIIVQKSVHKHNVITNLIDKNLRRQHYNKTVHAFTVGTNIIKLDSSLIVPFYPLMCFALRLKFF